MTTNPGRMLGHLSRFATIGALIGRIPVDMLRCRAGRAGPWHPPLARGLAGGLARESFGKVRDGSEVEGLPNPAAIDETPPLEIEQVASR